MFSCWIYFLVSKVNKSFDLQVQITAGTLVVQIFGFFFFFWNVLWPRFHNEIFSEFSFRIRENVKNRKSFQLMQLLHKLLHLVTLLFLYFRNKEMHKKVSEVQEKHYWTMDEHHKSFRTLKNFKKTAPKKVVFLRKTFFIKKIKL